MTEQSVFLQDEAATIDAGRALARAIQSYVSVEQALDTTPVLGRALVVYLQGGLGAGKTTLTRGCIQSLGHSKAVKSPTYTLVEPYKLPCGSVYHFDLYRLMDPQELDYMGIYEYFEQGTLCLLEWPDKGAEFIPAADLCMSLTVEKAGRYLFLQALTEAGKKILKGFSLPSK